VIFETDLGIIEIEVYPDKAPVSAADFLNYVDRGFYNGQGFYRTVRPDNDPREMGMSLVQGGRLDMEPLTDGIAHETTQDTGLSNIAGSIAIARDAPGTGSAAYIFINLGNNDFLDYGGARNADGQGYAVFGKVVSSLDVPRAIQAREAKRPTEEEFLQGQFLTKPVIIQKAYRK
jgi:peptidyl-prolyl cis-trans isomerase A (cyclophilin A)